MSEAEPKRLVDITNTEIAFSHKSDSELRETYRLFSLMGNEMLVNVGSKLGLLAIKMKLPFVRSVLKRTIFQQFCGGENLLDCQNTIDRLNKFKVLTILDYGAESKSEEDDLNQVMEETIRAIELAAFNNSVPVISSKLTGLADNDLLERKQSASSLTEAEKMAYERLVNRLDAICSRAHELGVGVFVDAEESWMQDAIDELVELMMAKYNKQKVIVYNTFQMYRHDRLQYLRDSHQRATKGNYLMGAKIVRGAYMEKERERAEEMNYESPIQKDKEATDRDFNLAVKYCVENYETIASCCASHNIESNLMQAELIDKLGLPKSHSHLNFCQLYGMSDYITYTIGKQGYNVAKYLPYGPVKEVVPYLIRRAQENTSITGEVGREMKFIIKEMRRRGLLK